MCIDDDDGGKAEERRQGRKPEHGSGGILSRRGVPGAPDASGSRRLRLSGQSRAAERKISSAHTKIPDEGNDRGAGALRYQRALDFSFRAGHLVIGHLARARARGDGFPTFLARLSRNNAGARLRSFPRELQAPLSIEQPGALASSSSSDSRSRSLSPLGRAGPRGDRRRADDLDNRSRAPRRRRGHTRARAPIKRLAGQIVEGRARARATCWLLCRGGRHVAGKNPAEIARGALSLPRGVSHCRLGAGSAENSARAPRIEFACRARARLSPPVSRVKGAAKCSLAVIGTRRAHRSSSIWRAGGGERRSYYARRERLVEARVSLYS